MHAREGILHFCGFNSAKETAAIRVPGAELAGRGCTRVHTAPRRLCRAGALGLLAAWSGRTSKTSPASTRAAGFPVFYIQASFFHSRLMFLLIFNIKKSGKQILKLNVLSFMF